MKRALLPIILIVIGINLVSQENKRIPFITYVEDEYVDVASVISINNEGFVLTGHIEDRETLDHDVFLVRTDPHGREIWVKSYGGNDSDIGLESIYTSDNSIVIAGSTKSFGLDNDNVYLIKINLEGDTIWTSNFGSYFSERAHSIIETPDKGFLTLGYSQPKNDFYLAKVDANGNRVWYETYGEAKLESGVKIISASDKCYLLLGYTKSFGNGKDDIYLIKVDSNGKLLWSKNYGNEFPEEPESIIQTVDGGYLIVGSLYNTITRDSFVYLLKINSEGEQIWTKVYENITGGASSVVSLNNGDFILTGGVAEDYDSNVLLLRVNSIGEIIWKKSFGTAEEEEYGVCVLKSSKGVTVVGNKSPGDGESTIFMISVSEDGDFL